MCFLGKRRLVGHLISVFPLISSWFCLFYFHLLVYSKFSAQSLCWDVTAGTWGCINEINSMEQRQPQIWFSTPFLLLKQVFLLMLENKIWLIRINTYHTSIISAVCLLWSVPYCVIGLTIPLFCDLHWSDGHHTWSSFWVGWLFHLWPWARFCTLTE